MSAPGELTWWVISNTIRRLFRNQQSKGHGVLEEELTWTWYKSLMRCPSHHQQDAPGQGAIASEFVLLSILHVCSSNLSPWPHSFLQSTEPMPRPPSKPVLFPTDIQTSISCSASQSPISMWNPLSKSQSDCPSSTSTSLTTNPGAFKNTNSLAGVELSAGSCWAWLQPLAGFNEERYRSLNLRPGV